MPGEIGGEEPADQRSCHRGDERWNGQPGHGRHQFVARRGAHQQQAPHRRHHRRTDALEESRAHEGLERECKGAGQGAEHEHEDRQAEDVLGPEPVRHPAADRYEDGQRHEIGRQRQLERDRILAEIGGDGRQRGRDHRRIHRLHEQGDGDDEGDEIAGHVAGVRGSTRRTWGERTPSVKARRWIG